jgi:hypothetical protein
MYDSNWCYEPDYFVFLKYVLYERDYFVFLKYVLYERD